MKIFFVSKEHTHLADESGFLKKIKEVLLTYNFVEEVKNPDLADALIIHEEYSFKNFHHIKTLLADKFISNYVSNIYTINFDDSATGLLKGLYSQIPKSRLDPKVHVAIPHAFYSLNDLVFSGNYSVTEPQNLASWRGNAKSNKVRRKIVRFLQSKNDCQIEVTNSWWNHSLQEKKEYIEVILNSKFSLCPAGWTPSTFRIYESMALGRCPVIIADDFAPPIGPPWSQFALFYPERDIRNLHSFLLKNQGSFYERGLKAKDAYVHYFRSENLPNYIASSLVNLIGKCSKNTKEDEIKRWRSLSFQWNNSWTIAQRIWNKIRL